MSRLDLWLWLFTSEIKQKLTKILSESYCRRNQESVVIQLSNSYVLNTAPATGRLRKSAPLTQAPMTIINVIKEDSNVFPPRDQNQATRLWKITEVTQLSENGVFIIPTQGNYIISMDWWLLFLFILFPKSEFLLMLSCSHSAILSYNRDKQLLF